MLGSKEFWGSAGEWGDCVAREQLWKEEQSFPLLEEASKPLAGTLPWHVSLLSAHPVGKIWKDLPEQAQSKEAELDVKKKKCEENKTNLSLLFKPLLREQGLWLLTTVFRIRAHLALYCPLSSPQSLYFGNAFISRYLLFGWMVMKIYKTFAEKESMLSSGNERGILIMLWKCFQE